MKYHEVINGPNGELWKEEVAKEHKRMIDSGVFEEQSARGCQAN
jgi:hypothetical protein